MKKTKINWKYLTDWRQILLSIKLTQILISVLPISLLWLYQHTVSVFMNVGMDEGNVYLQACLWVLTVLDASYLFGVLSEYLLTCLLQHKWKLLGSSVASCAATGQSHQSHSLLISQLHSKSLLVTYPSTSFWFFLPLHVLRDNLEMAINLLVCHERNLVEIPETYTFMGRRCKLHKQHLGPGLNPDLWGCEAMMPTAPWLCCPVTE